MNFTKGRGERQAQGRQVGEIHALRRLDAQHTSLGHEQVSGRAGLLREHRLWRQGRKVNMY